MSYFDQTAEAKEAQAYLHQLQLERAKRRKHEPEDNFIFPDPYSL